jgi:hypothetical protein
VLGDVACPADDRAGDRAEKKPPKRKPEAGVDRAERPEGESDDRPSDRADYGALRCRAPTRHSAGHLLDEVNAARDDRTFFDWEAGAGERLDGTFCFGMRLERRDDFLATRLHEMWLVSKAVHGLDDVLTHCNHLSPSFVELRSGSVYPTAA